MDVVAVVAVIEVVARGVELVMVEQGQYAQRLTMLLSA